MKRRKVGRADPDGLAFASPAARLSNGADLEDLPQGATSMFGREELERMRRKLQRRVIVSGVAAVIVLGGAFYLGRRQSPGATPGATIDTPRRDNEMAHHHAGR